MVTSMPTSWLSEDGRTKVEVITLIMGTDLFQRIIVKRKASDGWICTRNLATVEQLAKAVDLSTLHEIENEEWLREASGYHEFKS